MLMPTIISIRILYRKKLLFLPTMELLVMAHTRLLPLPMAIIKHTALIPILKLMLNTTVQPLVYQLKSIMTLTCVAVIPMLKEISISLNIYTLLQILLRQNIYSNPNLDIPNYLKISD